MSVTPLAPTVTRARSFNYGPPFPSELVGQSDRTDVDS